MRCSDAHPTHFHTQPGDEHHSFVPSRPTRPTLPTRTTPALWHPRSKAARVLQVSSQASQPRAHSIGRRWSRRTFALRWGLDRCAGSGSGVPHASLTISLALVPPRPLLVPLRYPASPLVSATPPVA